MFQPILVAVTTIAMAVTLGVIPATPARSAPLAWEQTGLTTPANRLLAPRSGALFAAPGSGKSRIAAKPLMRSDDGGTTWRPIGLPPTVPPPPGDPRASWPVGVTIDPLNHQIAYAVTRAGVYRSDDDSATWHLVDRPDIPSDPYFMVLDVSAADDQIVYVAAASVFQATPEFWWLRRSDDGGATWHDLARFDGSYAPQGSISAFYALPTDTDRALRATGGSGGGTSGHELQLSTDRGVTWSQVIPSATGPDRWYPLWFATGPDGTIYVSGDRDDRLMGSRIFSSVDGGQTWIDRFNSQAAGPPDQPHFWLESGGIAADPTVPGLVYAAFNSWTRARLGVTREWLGSSVKRSDDGGQTWTDVDTAGDPGQILDLAVGIDGRYLFAATETGVWRLPVQ